MIYKIGHAGAAGHAPGNTIASIKKALELNVDMIEIDVQLSQDGQVVLMHDATVDRTTNSTGFVNSKTLKQLKNLTVQDTEAIPTLQEALEEINRKAEVNIELKSIETAEPVAKIISEYIEQKNWEKEDFLISSFKIKALETFKTLRPDIRIGVLFSIPNIKALKAAKRLKAYSLNVDHITLSEEFIKKSHKMGYKVFAFTANDIRDIEAMKLFGADGIFSDYPELI